MTEFNLEGITIDAVAESVPIYTRGQGGSLTLIFEGSDATERYERVRQYGEVAGSYVGGTNPFGQPWFRERVRDDAPVNHVVVEFSPIDSTVINGVRTIPGFWIALDSYSDQTQVTGTDHAIDISFTVICRTDDFSTRSSVENEFSDEIVTDFGGT